MRKLMLGMALAVLVFSAKPSNAETTAGYVREVIGQVTILKQGKKDVQPARIGDGISDGDTIATGKDSRVHIEFADESTLVLAQNGHIVINKYVYDAKKHKQDRAEFTILDTAFSYVSGLMSKSGEPDIKMHLNFGTIGLRGTKLTRSMNGNECWIYLESGIIDVYNKGGKVTLAPGQGTTMSSNASAPSKPALWPKQRISMMKTAAEGKKYDRNQE